MQSVHNRGLLVISVSHLRSCVGAGIVRPYPSWPYYATALCIVPPALQRYNKAVLYLLVKTLWTVKPLAFDE